MNLRVNIPKYIDEYDYDNRVLSYDPTLYNAVKETGVVRCRSVLKKIIEKLKQVSSFSIINELLKKHEFMFSTDCKLNEKRELNEKFSFYFTHSL